MSWAELAQDNLEAAKKLLACDESRFERSAISRSYYAAYCAAVHCIEASGRRYAYSNGFKNPSHAQIKRLLKESITDKRRLKTLGTCLQLIHALQESRNNADYKPKSHVVKGLATSAVQQASNVVKELLE